MTRSRHFIVSRNVDSNDRYNFFLVSDGDVPANVIEEELRQVVFEFNEAYSSEGQPRTDLSPSQFSEVHESGPVLYLVHARMIDSPNSLSHLGGMYVPVARLQQIQEALAKKGYTFSQEPG